MDDERNVLDGLKLSLRPMRGTWDVSFVPGAREALALMEGTPQDVVVSDMRMPGLDGAQFLKEVRRLHPETARIILSGYSEQESVLRTVELAHQYLSKPCPPAELIQAVDKTLRLRDVLASDRIKSVISRLDSLPVLPPVYGQLMDALHDERSTVKHVGDIISQDVAMSASILKLVNSAFFAQPTRISGIHYAVTLLGSQTLRVLVLSTHLFATLKREETPDFSVKMLWEHSLRVARLAKAIGGHEGFPREVCDDCFIAGMLHDIGKLVLASTLRPEFDAVLAAVRSGNRVLHTVETEMLGVTHAEVGAYLMSLWGFNNPTVEAVCWHHAPERLDNADFPPQGAVMIADGFDHELVTIHADYALHPLDEKVFGRRFGEVRLETLRELCRKLSAEGTGKDRG